jgi:hypothetical protein
VPELRTAGSNALRQLGLVDFKRLDTDGAIRDERCVVKSHKRVIPPVRLSV